MKAKTKIQDLQVSEFEELTDFEAAFVVGGLSTAASARLTATNVKVVARAALFINEIGNRVSIPLSIP